MPKKFALKLIAEIKATPAEFADALTNENQRPNWELKLKQIKKKAEAHLEVEYISLTNPHNIYYDFEMMVPAPSKAKIKLMNFLVNE